MSAQITADGKQTLEKELYRLKNHKRPQLVDRLSYARSQGDLSENSDYLNAREELALLDDRIAQLESALAHATVVSKPSGNCASIGSQVTVKIDNQAQTTFQLVGEIEANPQKGKISPKSPTGQALIGKKKGDTVKVATPAGEITYQILKVG